MMEIFFRDKKNTGRESVWVGGLSFLERFSILMDWRRIYRDRFQYANRTHYPHSEPGVEEYSKACYSDQIFTIAQLGVQYGHMGYYFMTVAFMLVIVMLLS